MQNANYIKCLQCTIKCKCKLYIHLCIESVSCVSVSGIEIFSIVYITN